jgi:hypothetical protein
MKKKLFKIGMLTTRVIHATKLAKAKGFDYLPNRSKPITRSQKDYFGKGLQVFFLKKTFTCKQIFE